MDGPIAKQLVHSRIKVEKIMNVFSNQFQWKIIGLIIIRFKVTYCCKYGKVGTKAYFGLI